MSAQPTSILIATPAFGGVTSTQYAGSLSMTAQNLNVPHRTLLLSNESQIHRARNKCVAYARQFEFSHLLFIDADLGWSPEHIRKLLDSGKRIIGGTYPVKKLPASLNFNPLPIHAGYFSAVKTSAEFRRYAHDLTSNGIVRVKHVPTGFLLIEMGVFDIIAPHIKSCMKLDLTTGLSEKYEEFFIPGIYGGEDLSEDWNFCRMATALGEEIWLHTEVILPHVGTYEYRADV